MFGKELARRSQLYPLVEIYLRTTTRPGYYCANFYFQFKPDILCEKATLESILNGEQERRKMDQAHVFWQEFFPNICVLNQKQTILNGYWGLFCEGRQNSHRRLLWREATLGSAMSVIGKRKHSKALRVLPTLMVAHITPDIVRIQFLCGNCKELFRKGEGGKETMKRCEEYHERGGLGLLPVT